MKRFLIIALVLIVIVTAFMIMSNKRTAADNVELIESLQTEAARIDSLIATVGATGTVRTNQTANLTWSTSGNVSEVLVEVGDHVEKDDVLALLDETSVPQNVVLAKSDILTAESALEALYDSFDEPAVALANEQVQEAWRVFEYAEDNLWNLMQPYGQAKIDQAQANLVLVKDRVKNAREQYEKFENSGNDILVATLKAALAEAELSQASVENTLYIYTHNPATYTIANYEADLEVARINYATAQQNYEELLLGPDAKEIEAAEARITAAEMTLDLLFVRAPFDATITENYLLPGDEINAGKLAFRIDDYSRYLVDVDISEVDINRVELCQDVVLTFDAIFTKEYTGTVVDVAYVGNASQGVVSFEVTIEVTNPDDQIKPGMTSGVYITVEKLEDILIVPNRAVRVVDGNRVVYILDGNEIIEKVVVLGSSADLYSEVVSGDLKVGDLIILNPPSNLYEFGIGNPPGMGGGFPGMGN